MQRVLLEYGMYYILFFIYLIIIFNTSQPEIQSSGLHEVFTGPDNSVTVQVFTYLIIHE